MSPFWSHGNKGLCDWEQSIVSPACLRISHDIRPPKARRRKIGWIPFGAGSEEQDNDVTADPTAPSREVVKQSGRVDYSLPLKDNSYIKDANGKVTCCALRDHSRAACLPLQDGLSNPDAVALLPMPATDRRRPHAGGHGCVRATGGDDCRVAGSRGGRLHARARRHPRRLGSLSRQSGRACPRARWRQRGRTRAYRSGPRSFRR